MSAASPGWLSQGLATLLALLLVLVLAWLVLRTLRQLQPNRVVRPGAAPQVLHSSSLGPREKLLLVRHRGRDYLLGISAGNITVIDRWDGVTEAVVPEPG